MGGLYRRKPAPRDAEHADLPVAPRLRGYPLQHFQAVLLVLLDREHALLPVGVARAADVYAQAGVAMAGEVAVMHRVARRVDVALAVRQQLDDRRHALASPAMSGSHSFAASRAPSGIGIQQSSVSVYRWGKRVIGFHCEG